MVAGCANTAEILKEDLTWNGLLNFIIVFLMLLSGWYLYLFYTTRYSDDSLLGDLLTYLYFLGMSYMVMNTQSGSDFVFGAIVQRVAVMLLYVVVYAILPQTRENLMLEAFIFSCSTAVLALYFIFGDDWYYLLCSISLFIELPLMNELVIRNYARLKSKGAFVTPANIDHFTERQGCMLMVVLGESVVSAVINTNEIDPETNTRKTLGLNVAISLLVIYNMAIFYFAIVPSRDLNAQRRSVRHGMMYISANQVLFLSLLILGVGIKFVTEALLGHKLMKIIEVQTLFIATSVSLLCMLIIRLLHFWGREPKASDPLVVKRVKYFWWFSISLSPFLPVLANFLLERTNQNGIPPLAAVLTLCFTVSVYIILEHCITQYLYILGFGSVEIEHITSEEETIAIIGEGSVVGVDVSPLVAR
mmetsp:Transcript_33920/g.41808  ORF Transcript_33920/g.41808 Transcript_33920/m.41808 type:complete len:418 (-) Transcript_33920:1527-2780(-)